MTETNQRDIFYITALKASVEAGKLIMGYYNDTYTIEYKADNSPLTQADQKAHTCIAGYLKETNIPVLSEEGNKIPYEERKNWREFWMVDPLDGTKEFINKNGEFTVNIALIRDGLPVMGVVYVPVTGILYFGSLEHGSYRIDTNMYDISEQSALSTQHSVSKQSAVSSQRSVISYDENTHESKHDGLSDFLSKAEKLPLNQSNREVTIVGSRSHQNFENSEIIRSFSSNFEAVNMLNVGSSLKFCKIAEGTADFYPRLGPTMEWDTAAGHAVCKFAGAMVYKYKTRDEINYNKPNLLNPFFVVVNSRVEKYLDF